MTRRATTPPRHSATVARSDTREARATAFASFGASGVLDPQQIKNILEMRLAGHAVPHAVLEYALYQVCRLIDDGLLVSSFSDPR